MTGAPVPAALRTVAVLRRYPVKAMVGESLDAVTLDPRGLPGDRWYAVEDEDGYFASAKRTPRFRRRDAVFDFAAATIGSEVWVRRGSEQWQVGDPVLDKTLTAALGVPVTVTPERDVPHQDAGQISLVGTASLRWCEDHLGVDADPRRLRANIVVSTGEPFVEESWLGRHLAVEEAELTVVRRIQRCRTVNLAQDGLAAPTRLLTALGATRELCLGVYADVAAPGRIAVGSAVRPSGRW
jgi:uncharacterized protein YcbX